MSRAPYRESRVREGVALPRRIYVMRAAAIACVIAALADIGFLSWLARRPVETAAQSPLGCAAWAWMGLTSWFAFRVIYARGENPRVFPQRLLIVAFWPALMGELLAMLVFSGGDASDVMRIVWVWDVASVRVLFHSTTAFASMIAAIACVCSVMSIDMARTRVMDVVVAGNNEQRTLRIAPFAIVIAVLGVLAAIAFIVARVHYGTHRDGLGGFLGVALLGTIAVLGPLLAPRVRAIMSWHDEEDARDVARIALYAFIALAVTAISVERTILAYDELLAIPSFNEGTAFDVRLEAAHAIESSRTAHGLGALMLGIASLLPIITIVRSRPAMSGASFARASAWIGAMVIVTALASFRVRSAEENLSKKPPALGIPTALGPETLVLPMAPGTSHSMFDRVPRVPVGFAKGDKDGDTLVPSESMMLDKARVLVVDRNTSASRIMRAVEPGRPSVTAILAEGAPNAAVVDLGAVPMSLLGPQAFPIVFTMMPMFAPDGMSQWVDKETLIVFDDGDGLARVTTSTTKPRGMKLHRDIETREKRRALRDEMNPTSKHDVINKVVLAPHPKDDAQALVDGMVASMDLAPNAMIYLSLDRDALERLITGGAVVSP